jgi:hypothetical protein
MEREMSVDIRFAGQAITQAQLREFEQQRGFTLPADYHEFLLRTNGGGPVPNAFQFKWKDFDAYAHIGRFLGLNYPAALYSFEWNTRVQERISPRFFIIAKDYTQTLFHLVCLVVIGAERGNVYFLPQHDSLDNSSMETNEFAHQLENDYPQAYFVADSFTHLLEQLTEPPPGLFK